jgi:2-polyprenyl-6-hydroxyphenyl methylase/3-demethylubiquinone-9 3-methyltransferase
MSFISWFKRKILRDSRERWNYQYAKGQWDGLKDSRERERQEVVKDYFIRYANGGKLLEIGAGDGILPELVFQKQHYSSYVGVDVADEVMDKANKRLGDSRHKFMFGDMNDWQITEKFDVVLFNECINYAQNLDKTWKDALKNLNENGIFIVSMHEHKRSPEIWAAFDRHFTILEQKLVQNDYSKWMVKVAKPK